MTSVVHSIPPSAGPLLAAGSVLNPAVTGVRVGEAEIEIWTDETSDVPLDAIEYALHVAREVWTTRRTRAIAQHATLQRALAKETRARAPTSRARAAETRASEAQEYSRLCAEVDEVERRVETLEAARDEVATWAYTVDGRPLTRKEVMNLDQWFFPGPTRARYVRYDTLRVGDVIARAGAPRVEVVALDVSCEPDRFGQQLRAHRGRFVDGPAAGREGNLPFGPDGEAPVEFQK